MGILLADGFDNAFIGLGTRNGSQFAVYDTDKCIKILMDRDGMTEEEATDFFEYNVLGSLSDETDGNLMPAFVSNDLLDNVRERAMEEVEDMSHDDDNDMC